MRFWRNYLVAASLSLLLLEACSVCEPLVSPPGSFRVDFLSGETLDTLDTAFYAVYGITQDSFTFEVETFVYDSDRDDYDTILEVRDTVIFVPNLTPLYNSEYRRSQFLLPAHFNAEGAGFVFVELFEGDEIPADTVLLEAIAPRNKDTLFFNYFRDLVVIGPDCGFFEQIVNIDLSVNSFDSAFLRATKLETDSVNVEVYY
jgi:hypothetical protein